MGDISGSDVSTAFVDEDHIPNYAKQDHAKDKSDAIRYYLIKDLAND